MGIPVLLLGESGSGKSSSMRNLKKGEVAIFNVASKPFPFKSNLPKIDNAGYEEIKSMMARTVEKQPQIKTFVIDDSQYLMAFEMFDRSKESGYGKFTDIAVHFKDLIQNIIINTPPDVIVYLLHHVELTENGRIKAKTCGKMIDNQLTLEGLFSIVLMASKTKDGYKFETQSDGYTTCKSPIDMFNPIIDNDLKFVDTKIREYWELTPNNLKGE